jgi:zinc protease
MNRKLSTHICLLLILLLPLSLLSQKYNVYQDELDNGLDIIAIENSTVPLVTIEIDVRNGAYTESPEYDGLSHLYEHMFFKANASMPNQEQYLQRTRELGMVWNGTTSQERVNYYFTIPRDSLEEGLEFMKAAITTPLFLQEELERERPVVTGELDRAESSPFFHLGREIDKKLWFKYLSRKNVLGDRQVILTTDQNKMQTIQKRYYIPNNSALLVSGDVQHQQIFKLARQYFSDWKKGDDPFKLYPVPEHPPLNQSDTVIVEKPVNAITMQINLQGPSISKDPKATYAADVFSYILGQNNSEFQKQLVESGLCSRANIGYYTQDHTGPITISCQTSAEKFTAARTAIFNEIDKFTNPQYISNDQIEYAKTQLEIDQMYSQESPSQFIHTFGFWWAVSNGSDYYLNYVDNLKKITRQDMDEYVSKYIQDQPYIMGILISAEDRKKLSM